MLLTVCPPPSRLLNSTRGIPFPPKQAWSFQFEGVTLEGAKIRQRELPCLEAACFVRSIFALSPTPHRIIAALRR